MNENRYPTLAEIRASHAPKIEYERYLLASRFVFRPPSFPAIWLLVRLGITGETASWLSGLSALCGFVCLLSPGGPLVWPGIALLLLFNFFDCLDGGIARIMNARNSYGRFLDSIMWWADMLFWTVFAAAVWRMPELRACALTGTPPAVWAAMGVLCSFLMSYAAYLESVFDQVLRGPWEKLQAGTGVRQTSTPYANKGAAEVFVRALWHNLRVRETHYLLLIPACAAGCAHLLLAFFAVFNAAVVLSLLLTYCQRGRQVRAAELAAAGK